MTDTFRQGTYLLFEKLLTWVIVPQLRVSLLRLLGARIGRDVHIYEVRFINLSHGFRNLVIGDRVHIGPGTLIDLLDRVEIGTGCVISPCCILNTHTDAGTPYESPMVEFVPTVRAPIELRTDCYVGAGSTIVAGVRLGELTAVAAGSVVIRSTTGHELVGGVPARRLRTFAPPG